MRALHSVWSSYPLVVAMMAFLGSVAACSGEAGASATSGTANATVAEVVTTTQAAADGPAGHLHGGHPGGPDFLLFAALHEPINLTTDQQTAIQALLPSRSQRPFDKARAATLAAGVRAGNVVVGANAPPEDDLVARRTAASTALTTLHSTLTASQRRQLVDAIEKEGAAHEQNGEDHRGGPMGHGGRGPMDHLLEGLDLTAAQQQDLTTKLATTRPAPPSDSDRAAMKAEHQSMHAAMQAKLETFAGESFDAAAFVTPPAGAMKPGEHVDHFAADLAAVTSVLDATQREKLAQRIEAGPPANAEHAPPQ